MSIRLPCRYNPLLIEAAIALNENRLDVAERMLKPHLKEDPFDARLSGCSQSSPLASAEFATPSICFGALSSSRRAGAPRRPILHWFLGGWGVRPKQWSFSTTYSPTSPKTWVIGISRLQRLGRLGDFSEAIEIYEGVLAQAPRTAASVDELRAHAQDRGAADDGIAAYRKAIALRPSLVKRGGASRTSRP